MSGIVVDIKYVTGEAMRMLRQVARQPDKLSVYERSQGQLLLRNISLSSSVEVPSLASVHKNEVTFGAQKVRGRSMMCIIIRT
jgi:hypothetical protein